MSPSKDPDRAANSPEATPQGVRDVVSTIDEIDRDNMLSDILGGHDQLNPTEGSFALRAKLWRTGFDRGEVAGRRHVVERVQVAVGLLDGCVRLAEHGLSIPLDGPEDCALEAESLLALAVTIASHALVALKNFLYAGQPCQTTTDLPPRWRWQKGQRQWIAVGPGAARVYFDRDGHLVATGSTPEVPDLVLIRLAVRLRNARPINPSCTEWEVGV